MSVEPKRPAKDIKDPIEHQCAACKQTYAIRRSRRKPGIAGTFYVTQGHLQVTCPEGHREQVETTIQHTT